MNNERVCPHGAQSFYSNGKWRHVDEEPLKRDVCELSDHNQRPPQKPPQASSAEAELVRDEAAEWLKHCVPPDPHNPNVSPRCVLIGDVVDLLAQYAAAARAEDEALIGGCIKELHRVGSCEADAEHGVPHTPLCARLAQWRTP